MNRPTTATDPENPAMTTHLERPPSVTAGSARAATSPVRRPPASRLVAVELRKTVDTRSGRWLLIAVLGLALLGVGWRLWHVSDGPITFSHWFGTAMEPVAMLLPVLGVLAMTSEWSQRTVLTTFSLVPQRGRVLTAKLLAALALATVTVLVVAVMSAAGALVGGLVDSSSVTWGNIPRELGGGLVGAVLFVLMGAGFGALLQNTPLALIAYFVAPPLWYMVSIPLLGYEGTVWLDVYGSIGQLSTLRPIEDVAPVLVSLGAWILLPTALGVVRTLRREAA